MNTRDLKRRYGRAAADVLMRRQRLMVQSPNFACPVGCVRPCCTRPELYTYIDLLDLLMLGQALDTRPVEVFRRHVELGAEVRSLGDAYMVYQWQVRWQLRRPCPFLTKDKRCRVHELRPLSCRCFPEYRHIMKRDGVDVDDGQYGPAYACLDPAADRAYLDGREHRLSDMAVMLVAEQTASNLVVYRQAPVYHDIRSEIQEIDRLSREEPGLSGQPMPKKVLAHNRLVQDGAGGKELPCVGHQAVLTVLRRQEDRYRRPMEAILNKFDKPAGADMVIGLIEHFGAAVQEVDQELLDQAVIELNSEGGLLMKMATGSKP